VKIPRVSYPRERKQIDLAFSKFTPNLRHNLISHENTSFFVYRTPRWRNDFVHKDVHGQKLNGVINVGHTTAPQHPVWSPVETSAFERYMQGEYSDVTRDELARQILEVLYTVRNNLFHGEKRADDAYDIEVVSKGIPLLALIVSNFLSEAVYPHHPVNSRQMWDFCSV
jgi:hypothetical protein